MHQIEVTGALLQRFPYAHAEPERLAEGAPQVREHLGEIALALDLPVTGKAAGKVVVPQIEAGKLVEGDAFVEHRVRLPAVDLNGVAEIDQCLGEVTGVDALATNMWLATVGEVGDLQRSIGVEPLGSGRCRWPVGYCRHGLRGYRGRVTRRELSRECNAV